MGIIKCILHKILNPLSMTEAAQELADALDEQKY